MHGPRAGFTLIEVVVVVALTAITAGLVASLTAQPLVGQRDVRLRAELTDVADTCLQRMARDLRRALPNSVRVAPGGAAIEILHVADGARYRAQPGLNTATGQDHTAADDVLEFGGDSRFNVLGDFGELAFSYGTPLPAGHRLAIYTTGSSVWSDAAAGANPGVITPATTLITIESDVDEDKLDLSSAFQFALASPQQRLYLVDQPISYLCSTADGTLSRYAGYGVSAAQPTNPLVAPLSSASEALLANGIDACSFSYASGSGERAGLVTLDMTLSRGDEQVRLLREVHVVNVP